MAPFTHLSGLAAHSLFQAAGDNDSMLDCQQHSPELAVMV
jgi:hypothetical protein